MGEIKLIMENFIAIAKVLDKCPFGGMIGGYSCDDCGEKTRGDCPGIGGGKYIHKYTTPSDKVVDEIIKLLEDNSAKKIE